MKACIHCNEIKPLEEFRLDTRLRAGRTASCILCIKEMVKKRRKKPKAQAWAKKYMKEWHSKNKDANAKTHKAWLKKNFVRTKAHSCNNIAKRRVGCPPIDTNLLVDLYKSANGKCGYCGKGDNVLGFDHKTPLYRGGEHSIDNLIISCFPCNRAKNRKTLDEFREHCRRNKVSLII